MPFVSSLLADPSNVEDVTVDIGLVGPHVLCMRRRLRPNAHTQIWRYMYIYICVCVYRYI